MAGIYNITIDQGATFDRTLTWYEDDTRTSTVDLTDYTAAMQIRQYSSASDSLVSLTHSSGLTLGDDAGTVRILITDNQTRALTPGKCVYDLELTSGSGAVTRLLRGDVYVIPEVTR